MIVFIVLIKFLADSGSSVSIVSDCGLDGQGSIPDRGRGFFPLTSASRPALGPTQPPVQWVPGALSLGVKRGRGVMLTTHPLLVLRLRKSRSYTSCHPDAPVCSVTGPLYLLLYSMEVMDLIIVITFCSLLLHAIINNCDLNVIWWYDRLYTWPKHWCTISVAYKCVPELLLFSPSSLLPLTPGLHIPWCRFSLFRHLS
jgi:hypothetical protein